MSPDYETPCVEAAAEHARLNTPAIDTRHDDYEPDLGPSRHADDGRTLAEVIADIAAVMSR